ncbi:NAD-dependent epimerase/dehydratase family protein [Arthrobacter sp. EH-1B-1]|uniref:NAD-dependent epimerase/dehydratase family protein n=1 Tax=Arthrobacter vasquezii TaxID=2977629 RepID=A0ABT6CYR2_9MICC|nr:NAD-dependent epimerase/dehydratase family protein [Arthrobacter vasquezii]MDF9278730.1 NAD-dependent epimerase/dehydratase family protein [Arthrobacter vasquezii]
MKALVTGAAGFVGSRLVTRLKADGFDVVGVDSITDYYDRSIKLDNLRRLQGDNFEFIEGDLNSLNLVPLVKDVEYIFHQAGQPGVRKSWGKDFSAYTRANIAATQILLETVKDSASLKKFVYASSSSVYGNAERYPTSESDRPQPLSPYGVTKLAAEHLCSLYGENFGVPTVSLRYFTVYGPGQRPDMAFTRFVRALLTDGEVRIFGTGEQIRDYTFVDDVVDANVRAALSKSEPGEVFNVAGGTNISLLDAIHTLETVAGRSMRLTHVDKVAGDVARTGGTTDKINTALGWAPTVTLTDGLTEHFEWGRRIWSDSVGG